MLRLILLKSLLLSLMAATVQVQAFDLPALDKKISITVREQPVQQFLKTLFAQIRVPVVVSEQIEGLVNGRFDGTARSVLDEVTQAFNVTYYFDGASAHVYSANEMTRTIMPVSNHTARRVEQMAQRMSLGDSNNRLDSSGGGGLIVTGTRRFLQQVEELSFSVQANTEKEEQAPMTYRVFYLSNAWAADTSFDIGGQSITVSGVATLLRELIVDGRLGVNPDRGPAVRDNTLDGLRGQGLQASDSTGSGEPLLAAALENDSADLSEGVLPTGNSARIVADSRLNAVIIRDTADRMPAYQELISDLDRPSQMVEIEATIIDVNTDKTRELGIGWEYRRSDVTTALAGGVGGVSGLIIPNADVQGPGAVLSTILGGREQFLAQIRALEEKGAARVVSKPHVITLSDVEAVLATTTEFFVRVAGSEEVDLFNVPVGTTLRVTPHVFQETGQSRIKLLVNIEDGAASSEQVDQIPVVERANINTQAVISEGDSLLIGGLVRDSYQQINSGIPLLGQIPFVGRLFKSTANQASRVERLFMITPRTAEGLGFGLVNDGRRDLPVLQGDHELIEQQAGNRVPLPNQPFGRQVNDIPFKPLDLPEIETVFTEHSFPQRQSNPTHDERQLLVPAPGQWVAIPGSEMASAVAPTVAPEVVVESAGPRPDQKVGVPVSVPQAARSRAAVLPAVGSEPKNDDWVSIPGTGAIRTQNRHVPRVATVTDDWVAIQ